MLFASSESLFYFLPASLFIFHIARNLWGGNAAMRMSVAASLFFYGWWNPYFLLLIFVSLGVNFTATRALITKPSKLVLSLVLAFNLALLGYFKYRNFFLENMDFIFNGNADAFGSLGTIFIPLGISFYTFQQIALLLDAQDGAVEEAPDLLEDCQFSLFFPQLIAGPIVLFRELSTQFKNLARNNGVGLALFGPGLMVFILGLFKKICLADNIAPFADAAFNAHESITLLEAWAGSLAYMLQLYFDFSGYSDMAVGLGLMFGFRLPLNFDTPYIARNMVDFWKRWHMTMTRFFMMYLYTPLALSLSRYGLKNFRHGIIIFLLSVAVPTMVTFLLSGLWHGAGWTFIAFGAVNGIGLIAVHVWKEMNLPRLPMLLGWGLTMLCALVSFVYFRAESLSMAHNMLAAMVSPQALIMPGFLESLATQLGLESRALPMLASGTYAVKCFVWVTTLGVLSIVMPNWAKTYEDIKPSWGVAFCAVLLGALVIGWLDKPQTFLYFQF